MKISTLQKNLYVSLAASALFMLTPQGALADPLSVSVMPWAQGRVEAPHLAVRGEPTALQAIAEDGECGGRYEYRWDWNGDGDFADPEEGFRDADASDYAGFFAPLPLEVTLPNRPSDHLFLPRVEVHCGDEVVSAEYPVLLVVEGLCADYFAGSRSARCEGDARLRYTRSIYSARALDRALWRLFLSFEHQRGDGLGHDEVQLCAPPASKPLYALGHALNALIRRGHGHGPQRDADPYYRHAVRCGVNALLTTMTSGDVSFADSPDQGIAGEGLFFAERNELSAQYPTSYESTAWVEPIALLGDADLLAEAGEEGVFGRSLRSISQDLADGLIECMGSDYGWSYECARGVAAGDDASSNGWAPEALRLLTRSYGVETYETARDGQRGWLETYCPGGVCPYHGGGPKLAGNALASYGWVDEELFDPLGATGDTWRALGQWYDSGDLWGLYFIYTAVKGMRSFTPELDELGGQSSFSESLIDFFVTGEDANHVDVNARQAADGSWAWIGDWAWGASISTVERTALIAQIIESWPEVAPVALAYPREIGPGESITFDHSRSHLLSYSVTVTSYEWDVATYIYPGEAACDPGVSGCRDLNGDGDCADAGERCNEDRNGDGVVSDDEIVWEFETIDPDAGYVHRYLDPVSLGERVDHPVRLRITDSQGRTSEDQTSVAISVSLENHPPIVVDHPEGREVRYVGHPDSPIALDGRASFDPDSARVPSGGLPPGVADQIMSISFDLNFDGDFDAPQEQGLARPVELILPEDVGLGDRYSVMMRVCDDGQWATCRDGRDQPDCSRCAYSAAIIDIVPNQNDPVIDTCFTGLPCEDGYDAEVDGDAVGAVQLDLSESYDPDGDLHLSFTYEVIEGEGEILEAGFFPGDQGARARYLPRGEGERVDVIRATVTDSAGRSDSALIEIRIPNVTPRLSWGELEVRLNPPRIIRAEGRDEWSGRFRVVVDARVVHGAEVIARPDAEDTGDAYTVMIDYDQDGVPEQQVDGVTLDAEGAPPFAVDDGYTTVVTAWSVDDNGAESQRPTIDLAVPSKGEDLTYRFDVGADGSFEEAGTQDNFHVFFNNDPNVPSIPIAVEVIDELGATSTTLVEVSLQNRPPSFIQTSDIAEGYSVTFVTSATDPDLDQLTYRFVPGDGGVEQQNESGVFVHAYAEAQASYNARVVVSDGRGGEAEHLFVVSFLPPVDLPPVIDLLTVSAGPGGSAEALVEAYDPEGQVIAISLDWGDGLDPARVVGGRAERSLAFQEAPYLVSVTVSDPSGQTASRQAELDVEDAPTIISSAQQSLLSSGEYMFTLIARDLDSPQLEYFWDFDGDGVWDEEATAPNVATHRYPDQAAYRARLGARDPWSGVITEVEVEVPSVEPLPPEITSLSVNVTPGGVTRVVVEAVDPEGEGLIYEVTWGDALGEIPTPAPLGIANHVYAYREDAYLLRAIARDPDGLTAEATYLVELINAPTEIEATQRWLEGTSSYDLRISASDADSPRMRYYWDFNNDGQWDLRDQEDRGMIHSFDTPDPRTVRAGAIDLWSGVITETTIDVNGDAPPEILALRLSYAPRGETALDIEARDPEGGALSYEVWWGDEPAPQGDGQDGEPRPYIALTAPRGEHAYPFAETGYRGWVRVTDQRGLTAEASFIAVITDQPTELRELVVNRIVDGEVALLINARDLDTPDGLLYSVDARVDDVWEAIDQLEPSARLSFDRAGVYPIKVRVTDPWSGRSVERTTELTLPAWVRDAISEDHVIGEEGSCVVFRASADGQVASKVDPTRCESNDGSAEQVNEGEERWSWRFGDGARAEGSEVGHRYADDGVYTVELENDDRAAPRRSQIQAYISNAPPRFTSVAPESVIAGQVYNYRVEVADPGRYDLIELKFGSSRPEGMMITPVEGSPRAWTLSWETPELNRAEEVTIELVARDGNLDDDQQWVADGGEARQRFLIRVLPTPFDPFGAEGDFVGTGHGVESCDQASGGGTSTGIFIVFLTLLGLLRLHVKSRLGSALDSALDSALNSASTSASASRSLAMKRAALWLATLGGVLALSLLILSISAPKASHAQDLQLFTPASGDWNYVNVEGARILPSGAWMLSGVVSHGQDPLVRINERGEVLEVIVGHITGGELNGVIGLFDWAELALHVPYFGSSGLSQPYPVDDASGLGDLRLSTKISLTPPRALEGSSPASGFASALTLTGHLPTGEGEREASRRHLVTEARLSAEYRQARWRASLNGGYRHLSSDEPTTVFTGSSGATWGLGLGFTAHRQLEVISEVSQRLLTLDRAPAEALIALRARPDKTRLNELSLTLGGGAGLGTGYSSVTLRLFAGLTWRPSLDRPQGGSPQVVTATCAPTQATGDQDGDRVADAFDRCPDQPEDQDGFEDADGCPDLDNDHDGIKDQDDKCPMHAEVINQYQDEDGCPDQRVNTAPQAPQPAQADAGDEHAEEGQLLEITERVFFKHNRREILPKSFSILNQVAQLLKRYPQITKLRVEGHTDDTGGAAFNLELSRGRAEAVRDYLIKRGIEAKRLAARGYGDQRPIASNDTEEGRALNRRVNFRITEGPQEIFVIDEESGDARSSVAGRQGVQPTTQSATDRPQDSSVEPTRAQDLNALRYAVQVKASTRLRDSERMTRQLDRARFKNYTLSVRTPDQKMIHRVRLGPYTSRAEAERAIKRYQERFPKSAGVFIIKISTREAKNALR